MLNLNLVEYGFLSRILLIFLKIFDVEFLDCWIYEYVRISLYRKEMKVDFLF